MTTIQSGTKEYKRAKLALFIGGFVTFATVYTTQPLMPVFAEEFNVSAPAASLTLSLTTGFLAIIMLGSASLSERIGMKNIMVFSMIITSCLGLLSSFSPNFISLLIFRALIGIFVAGVPSIAMAFIGEEFHLKARAIIMGFYISGSSIGGMTGRILTGLLTDLFTWRTAFIIIGVGALILSFSFWYLLPKPQPQLKKKEWATGWRSYKLHLTNKQLLFLFILSFLLMGSFATMYNYIGFLLTEPPYKLSQTVIGFIFIVYLFGSFSSIYMGAKAAQYGKSFILKLSIILTICGAALTLLPTLIFKIIGISLFTFGFFGSHSIASTLVAERAKVNKTQASSLYLLCYYLGSSFVGSFSGYFWEHFHWIGVIAFICSLLAIGFVLVLVFGSAKFHQIQRRQSM
ncbi:MFS transporter [Bacillus sp. FJAT-29790]|uniref:MFS transporter n=1 Tax=Bacillus sp. FJAT-29790 TaxID=1895002 RepID=UPI001C2153BC|nr:MFS transporter [Bacillus sp. FJAT-29790]MBU8880573.1 MFS transporter [Bacillus sp. FJAT-29790]